MASTPKAPKHDGLATAFSLLTVVPTGPAGGSADSGRQSVKWMPVVGVSVGAAVGVVCAGVFSALRWAGVSELPAVALAAVAGVVTDFAVTRGMHWDGLADVADAWWGGFDRDRRLEIMGDSAVGTFGTFAVVGAFAALAIGLGMATSSAIILVPAFAISRLAAVFAAQLGKPAKPGGLGATVLARGTDFARGGRAAFTWLVAVASCLGAVAIAAAFVAPSSVFGLMAASLVSIFGAAALPHLIASRMGGVTGDVIGASILLTEIVAVLAFAVGT